MQKLAVCSCSVPVTLFLQFVFVYVVYLSMCSLCVLTGGTCNVALHFHYCAYHLPTCSVCSQCALASGNCNVCLQFMWACTMFLLVVCVCCMLSQAVLHTCAPLIIPYKQCVHCSYKQLQANSIQAVCALYKQLQAATSSVCIAVSESCLQCVPLYVFFCVYSSMCLITCKMRCFSLVQEKQLMAMR